MVHGLRELTDPGVNWEKRMEKPGMEREAGGAEQAPVGIVGLGKTEYRAEPQFCPSECLGPWCFILQPCRLGL